MSKFVVWSILNVWTLNIVPIKILLAVDHLFRYFILQGIRKICSNHRSIPCFYILTKRMMWKILETHATSRVCNLSHIYLINETYNVVHMKGRKCVEWWCKIIKLFNTVNSFVIMIVLYSLYSSSIVFKVCWRVMNTTRVEFM